MSTNSLPEKPAKSTMVIVCGLPASGKSTLAEAIAEQLMWPLFTKDAFKELLWDSDRTASDDADLETSHEIGQQAIASLLHVAWKLGESRVPAVIECNFLPEFAERDIEPLTQIAAVKQVHCAVSPDLALSRFSARRGSASRHPIHADAAATEDLARLIERGAGEPLPISAPLLEVDTSDGYDPTLVEILEFCRA